MCVKTMNIARPAAGADLPWS